MLLLALASGSALRGGLSMLCFSLGTLPLLLGYGSLAAWLGKKFTGAVLSCGAVLIAVFGLSMLSQGGSLTGLFTPTALLLAAGWMCIALFLRKLPLRTWQKAGAAGALLVLLACVPRLLPEQENVDVARMEGDVQVVESQLLAWDYADRRGARPLGDSRGCGRNQRLQQSDSLPCFFHRPDLPAGRKCGGVHPNRTGDVPL